MAIQDMNTFTQPVPAALVHMIRDSRGSCFRNLSSKALAPDSRGGPWESARRGGRTANAPVLKTGVRKDLWVRIPSPPLYFTITYGFGGFAASGDVSGVLPKVLPDSDSPRRFSTRGARGTVVPR